MKRIHQYLWALPNTIIGLLLALAYLPKSARWHKGVLEFHVRWIFPWWTTVVGQTWGCVVVYRPRRDTGGPPGLELQRHERQHVVQGLRWGPLFLLAYPVMCLVALVRGKRPYRDCWFELDADRARTAGPDYPELRP